MPSPGPRVSIIILNWNTFEVSRDCILSLRAIDYPYFEVVLVDNGSVDSSGERLAESFPEIRLLRNEKNLGFAGGCNVGIRDALARGADYVLLLNNDTVVAPDFLSQLVRVAESDPKIGVLNPKIYFFAPPDRINYAGGMHTRWRMFPYMIGHLQKDEGQFDQVREVSFLTGCAMLIKAEVIRKIGLLELAYFHLIEDVEWSLRATRAGYKGVYVPQAVIWHKEHYTAEKHHSDGFLEYYFSRNNVIFARKHVPLREWPLKMTWLGARTVYRTFVYAFAGDWDKIGAMYRGLWSGSTTDLPKEDTHL